LRLELLSEEFSLVQLSPVSTIPEWATGTNFYSLTRTADEVSMVVPQRSVPLNVKAEKGWRCIRIQGILDFEMVGVLAALAVPLARAGIPIFVLSTYNTDHLFVRTPQLERAIEVLKADGHQFTSESRTLPLR
jgi:hypothetical protein